MLFVNAADFAKTLERAATDIREGKLASISLAWDAPANLVSQDPMGFNDVNKLRSPDAEDLKFAGKLEALVITLRNNPAEIISIRVAWPVRSEGLNGQWLLVHRNGDPEP